MPVIKDLVIILNQLCGFKEVEPFIETDTNGSKWLRVFAVDVIKKGGSQALASLLNDAEDLLFDLLCDYKLPKETIFANIKYLAEHGYPVVKDGKIVQRFYIITPKFNWCFPGDS